MTLAPVCVLSKIRRPPGAGLVQRPRLVARLEQLRRSARCVWVGAPAGAGKTALLASFLDRHPEPVVWYQLDQGDCDPAQLFHYLGLAAAMAPEPQLFPALQSGHLDDLPAFAQRYFARMFGPGPGRSVLVFDSYQAVRDDPAFHLLIRVLLAALPEHVDAFILSRLDPPPELARLLSAGQLLALDWEQLRLTPDETFAIVEQRCGGQPALPAFARYLHACTGGWVAGLNILLAHSDAESDAAEALFAYFSEEVFAACSPDLRRFLLHTAVLPSFTADMAQAITGNPFAAGFLQHSLRQHCFIERFDRQDLRVRYRHHRLFRDFLLAQLRIAYSDREARALRERAIGLLQSDGDLDGSAHMLIALADTDALAAFAVEHATLLVEQGRQGTLGALLAAVPPAVTGADGRLLYWLAVCCAEAGPALARARFERAVALLAARGDASLCLLAWSGMVECIDAEGRDLRALGHALETLEQLRIRFPHIADTDLATPVLASALTALTVCPAEPVRQAAWVHQALVRLVSADANGRALLASRLCGLYCRAGDFAGARMALAELHIVGELPQLDAAVRAAGMLALAMGHWLFGDGKRVPGLAEQAEALIVSAGLAGGRHAALNQALAAALGDNDLAGAEGYCVRINAVIEGGRPIDQALYRYLLACVAMQRGEAGDTSMMFELSVIRLRSVGDRFVLACALADYAYATHLSGDGARARALCAEASALCVALGSKLAEYKSLLVQAAMERDGAALSLLARALALGRSCQIINFPGWNPRMMAGLAALALQAGVEPSFSARLVQERSLRIPSDRPAAWPWALQLRTLGQFEVMCGGAPLPQTGKGNRRTLDLLKAIVAFGGREVAIENLTAALWPDADGDSAKGAFDVAMHRLRKLIGGERVFIVSNGKVSLNADVCWLDIWVFREHAQRVLDCSAASSPDPDAIAAAASGMLEAYRGRFLASEVEQPWLLPMRDRLRRLLVRAADRAGPRLHAGQRFAAASALRLHTRETERA